MPRYDYTCNQCANVIEAFVSYDEREKPQKCECGGVAVYQFPATAALGFQPYEPWYNEALGCDVNGRREHQQIMSAMGLEEAGDSVHGARNFDKHAPHHVKPLPPKGVTFSGQQREKEPAVIGTEKGLKSADEYETIGDSGKDFNKVLNQAIQESQ